jgi:Tol biopolymer transport system component
MRLSLVALLAIAVPLASGPVAAIDPIAFSGPPNGSVLSIQSLDGIPFQPGDPFNGSSSLPAKSADDRFLLLYTSANNLAPGIIDVNERPDFYVFDRATESYDLIGRSAAHPERAAHQPPVGLGTSPLPSAGSVSDDGRWVAFSSSARDMIAGASYSSSWEHDQQVFLFDRLTRTYRLVSHAWDNPTVAASRAARLFAMSADGRFVAFESSAANLAAAEPSVAQIYLFDRDSGESRLVSHRNGQPGAPALAASSGRTISPDGRFLLFTSKAVDLVAGQIDGADSDDAFLFDRQTGALELLSRSAGNGSAAAGGRAAELSADGRFVTLSSDGVALAAGLEDGNGNEEFDSDCFLLDRQTGSMRLVSRSAANASRSADARSSCQALSQSGRHVFFTSNAGDLVAGFNDRNQFYTDAYVFDAQSGTVTLASHAAGSAADGADGYSLWTGSVPGKSGDRYQLMLSRGSDLQAGVVDEVGGGVDLFLYDLEAGVSTLVSRVGSSLVAGGGADRNGSFYAADGGILFVSGASLDPDFPFSNGQAQVFRYDPARGSAALELWTGLSGTTPAGWGTWEMLDRGGRYFGYFGLALDAASGDSHLIVHVAGAPATPSNGDARIYSASSDGRFFTYATNQTDVAPVADGNGKLDVFVYDRAIAAPQLVSHVVGNAAVASSGESFPEWTSGDGSRVIFLSSSVDLVPGFVGPPLMRNVYYYDRGLGKAELISHGHGAPSAGGLGMSALQAATPDALRIAYWSLADNLVPGFVDNNPNGGSLYFYDRAAKQALLVDRRAGAGNQSSSSTPTNVKMSADGSSVFFSSQADDLFAGQVAQPGTSKIFRWNRATGENELVVHDSGNPSKPCAGSVQLADISADGRWVLLWGTCSLVAGDANGTNDVYLHDRIAGSTRLVSHPPGDPGASLGVDSRAKDLSDNGRRIVFEAAFVPYVYDRPTASRRPLLTAYYDPQEVVGGNVLAASADGSRIFVTDEGSKAFPFDTENFGTDYFLVTLDDLFADGFESGDTANWSQAVP